MPHLRAAFLSALLLLWIGPQADSAELDLSPLRIEGLIQTSVGVTRQGTPIPAVITSDDLEIESRKLRLLLVAGLDGSDRTTQAAIHVLKRFYMEADFAQHRQALAVSAIICGNPDGLRQGLRGDNGSGGNPSRGYPPTGDAYLDPKNPETHYIWRWIGMHAPDLVVELVEGNESGGVPKGEASEDSLAHRIERIAASSVGTVPALQWRVGPNDLRPFATVSQAVVSALQSPSFNLEDSMSPARKELRSRIRRPPLVVCEQLAKVYGHDLPSVAYIPAVACLGRVRLGELSNDRSLLADVERIVAPFRERQKPTLTDKSGGSEIAGNILWGALYDATKNKDYLSLVLEAANTGFNPDGSLRESMPNHLEMSDSVFMGCPILALAGRLTGDKKYYDMCLRHLRFMARLNVRADGLHRHSPLDETAWGRGNGFPALGLALALSDFSPEHSGFEEVKSTWRAHLNALLRHQDPTGTWHQIVDRPESYRELTSTCMITFALIRGVRRSWLPREEFEPAIRRGWTAIKSRVAADGGLVDVCTGTGKMKSQRDYFDRVAILGKDGRGGAMALLVATEMAAWEKGL